MRIKSKVALFFIGLFLLLFIQGVYFVSHERNIFYNEMEDKGRILAENLAEISRDAIVNYQFGQLIHQIQSTKSKTDIDYIKIVNERNLAVADTRIGYEGWIYSGKLASETRLTFEDNIMLVKAPIYIMGTLRGNVEIAFPLHVMNSKIRKNALVFIIFFMFEIIAALMFLAFFEMQLVKPLDQLAQNVTDITPDSLIQPLQVPSTSTMEIRRVSGAIEQMKDTIQKAQEENIEKTKLVTMGKIAANFAHEIRNPLEAISGSVEILSYSIEKESEEDEYVSIIREEIGNLNDYLERFLEFAKNEPVHRAWVDIEGIIHDAVLLLRPLYVKKNIACISRISSAIPECYLDGGQIRRVLINLILNSIESMDEKREEKKQEIIIEAESTGSLVRIVIKDHGTGIDPGVMDKLFEPYVTTKSGGSGIGLSICRKIISQHEGSIRVIASSVEGTQIEVRLPVRSNEASGGQKSEGQ
ncbi:MAG: GHKL domain-containing protein [Spirochaetia bacterium]|nr:GHKL domain-containing protein [Spirochaetia bacterium]